MDSLPAATASSCRSRARSSSSAGSWPWTSPTTSLTDAETEHLFAILEGLRARGLTLIYVSHRLPEVFRLCDRITVLRDGTHVSTLRRADVARGSWCARWSAGPARTEPGRGRRWRRRV
jgi:hypothetical protein